MGINKLIKALEKVMYTSGGNASSSKKQRPSTSYLVRPKLGALKSFYSNRPLSALSNEKRRKSKKTSTNSPKMEFRRKPDYADTAYREAVSRLRILMAESYTPLRRMYPSARPFRELDSAGEDTDNQSMISAGSRNSKMGRTYYNFSYNPITPRKYYYPPLKSNIGVLQSDGVVGKSHEQQKVDPVAPSSSAPPEFISFIERQEDYIEQLEKESRFCKDELSSLLSKVKEVISENENLHQRQKSKLIKSVFDHLETETETETELEFLSDKTAPKSPKKSKKITRIVEGPSIVFESRISELEAQLTQAKIDLKKSQEDNDSLRKKLADGSYLEGSSYESFKKQLDSCNSEKEELLSKLKGLQSALSTLRDKETDTCDQVKKSLEIAEQAQYEKNTAELEIRRLKDELERQHLKLRDAISDQNRRIADERSAVERRYTQQIEQLTTEVGVQWETTNKLQLELDKQRRENSDLRRECAQKQALIDELKKEMQNKILTLQSDIGTTGAEKGALEQQISTLNMANERSERQYKQEITRLQAEMQSLRQRMDRADADLIHSRRENIRLNEQIASLEKEININAALTEERAKSVTPRSGEIMALPPPTPKKDGRDKELSSMIKDMENKHVATVVELENMIRSQNQLMNKLSTECHALTRKLEDSSHRHKEEIRELQTSLGQLNNKFAQVQYSKINSKDEEQPSTITQRHLPSPQASTTPQVRRSESRSSLKQRSQSRTSSRQPSQEKLSLNLSPAGQQSPKNEPDVTIKNPVPEQYEGGEQYLQQYDQQQYVMDPDQQYANIEPYPCDPNVQYDPNQQYEGQYDTGQEYGHAYGEDIEQYGQEQYYGGAEENQQIYGDGGQQGAVEESAAAAVRPNL
ncbi:serologically defined colon cancer antigen 8 homolog [Euwallacea similis]|uniref:serologically defined colon cancer antigen 8 homolog n=1 Tax=Euwallacea similis TaxID=1736056 RepID=UPI00344CEFA4